MTKEKGKGLRCAKGVRSFALNESIEYFSKSDTHPTIFKKRISRNAQENVKGETGDVCLQYKEASKAGQDERVLTGMRGNGRKKLGYLPLPRATGFFRIR